MKAEHSKRWMKTEERMEKTALDLMQDTDLAHITVRAICEKAHVNRTTFYDHFHDVYDLFDKMEMTMNKGIMDRYTPKEQDVFSIQSFIPFFTHVKDNQNFYRIVLKTRNTFPLKQGFDPLLNDVIKPICMKANITDEEEIMYYLVFFQAGFTMCLRCWVETGCKESEEELARLISNCLPAQFVNNIE